MATVVYGFLFGLGFVLALNTLKFIKWIFRVIRGLFDDLPMDELD